MDKPALRTADQAKKWLEAHGVTQAQFAERHKLNYQALRNVLAGRNQGRWGDAHRAAVLLGMKPAPEGQPPLMIPLADATQSNRKHRANKTTSTPRATSSR